MCKFLLPILLFFSFNLFADTVLHPFRSDGCSRFPEGTPSEPTKWLHCCVAHDLKYWRGGDREDRKNADLELRNCIGDLGHKATANLMYKGVRFGGSAYVSGTFRKVFNCRLGWGNGWDEDRGYQKLSIEEQEMIEAMTPEDPNQIVKKFCQNSLTGQVSL